MEENWSVIPTEKIFVLFRSVQWLKKINKKFGLDENSFSLHSCRIGATTDSLIKGLPLHIIDKRGRWKDPAMKLVYTKETDQEIHGVH